MREAVSVSWPPTGTEGEAWVEKLGTRLATCTCPAGSPQTVVEAVSFASPL